MKESYNIIKDLTGRLIQRELDKSRGHTEAIAYTMGYLQGVIEILMDESEVNFGKVKEICDRVK